VVDLYSASSWEPHF